MHFVVNVSEFLKSWEQLQARMDSNGQAAWRRAVREAYESQREHGYQNDTGRLTASMSWRTAQRRRFGWSGEVVTKASYAAYVDSGTKPHVITARRVPFLRFFWPKIGGWFVGKRVNHPGFKGAKFSDHARQVFEQNAPAWLQQALDSAVQ